MNLHPTQAKIAEDRHRYRVICSGRRWGKTTLSVEEIKGMAVYRQARIAYVAPTYQQARDIAWELLIKELKPIAIKINESRLEITVRTLNGGTSWIALRGWESIETLRGQKFDLLVLDEVAMMRNFWSMWQEVLRPTLTDNEGQAIFISTPKGFNHFYELYNKESSDKDYQSFHFTSYDNPYLLPAEIDKAKLEVTEDRFAQEYLADFRKTEGLVYKEFDRTRHLFEDKDIKNIAMIDSFAGLDFGFTNPCALISIKKDYDGHYWVIGEWYKNNKTEDEVAEYVAALNFPRVYPDPESPSGIEALKRRRVNVREVIKNKDSIKSGIEKIRNLFKENKLRIHRNCENLIFELETYSYPDKKDLRNAEENPIKENDHALDALRYALMMATVSLENTKARIHTPSNLSRVPFYKI